MEALIEALIDAVWRGFAGRKINAEAAEAMNHAISPGPLKTRAASGISDFDELLQKAQAKARRALSFLSRTSAQPSPSPLT